MKLRQILMAGFLLTFAAGSSYGQFLSKLKQKATQAADKAIDKKLGINQPTTPSANPNGTTPGSAGSGNPSNTTGGGLISTPPNVTQNLIDAEGSYKKLSYSDARQSIQQAMLGVELEIGNKVLKSLPVSISGLNKTDKDDQVASSGAGWAGLIINRKYSDGKNKQLDITIANNSAWMSALNIYFSGAYAQQGGQQNWKQTTLKGNKAIIEFDKSSGYKLSVPLGQSSLIIFQGINFSSEADIMSAAGNIDIDDIKKQLGEQ